MQLTTTEEQLMHHLWKLENAFLKDLIELYPDPKPATTTVATLLKRMTDKQFVGYKMQSNTRIYFPLVSKNEYFSKYMNGLIKNFLYCLLKTCELYSITNILVWLVFQ